MQVNLYSGFSKRINSTKLPNTTATVKNGTLRNPCSVTSPEIEFKTMGQTCPANFCYAYIPSFQRYYFITDWVAEGALWVCRMTEDCLASWRTRIGQTNAYIDRCASFSDGNIVDTQYLTTTNFNITAVPMSCDYYQSDDSHPITGCFVIGVIDSTSGADSQTGGAVTFYALTPAQCKSLMSYLMSDQFLSANGFPTTASVGQQITNDVAKAFVKPIDYIVSCVWYPLPVSAFSSANDHVINVGYWLISQTVAVGKIVQYMDMRWITGTIPDHPQANTRGEYLNYAPYSRLELYIPPFGIIPIDMSYRRLGKYLVGEVRIDPYSGIGKLSIFITNQSNYNYNYSGALVAESSVLFGVPVQLAQINADFYHSAVEVVQAGIHTAGGIASALTLDADGTASHASQAVSHMANAVDYLSPQIRTSGTDGSRLLIKQQPRMTYCAVPIVDEDNEEMGRPLRQKKVINTCSGFVKCFEVTVDYPCYDTEKSTILNHLLTGFFWE